MILVAGATGHLGSLIVEHLKAQGRAVRALTRASADPEKLERLRGVGAELVAGDLKDPPSLQLACEGVEVVISTATSIVSRQAGDGLDTVDRDGNIALFRAAEAAGAHQAIFVSFQPHELEFPLQDAKRAVEQHLAASSLGYTVFQPTCFTELWLGPALMPMHGFDFGARHAKVAGSGEKKLSWISIADVARFVVGAVGNPKAARQSFVVGGPEALSPNEVVGLLQGGSGKPWTVEHIPEGPLREGASKATSPFDRSFSALLASFAAGYVADTRAALAAIPFEMQRVSDHIDRTLRYTER
jgi:uncharacterized protein YbjT (DUF2867 family)